jgi:hypothetical protein
MRFNELLEKSKQAGVTVEERDEARSLYLQLAELRKAIAGPNARVYGGLSPEGVISLSGISESDPRVIRFRAIYEMKRRKTTSNQEDEEWSELLEELMREARRRSENKWSSLKCPIFLSHCPRYQIGSTARISTSR